MGGGRICDQEIGLCAQNMLTILGSILNIIDGDLYDNENVHFDKDKIII